MIEWADFCGQPENHPNFRSTVAINYLRRTTAYLAFVTLPGACVIKGIGAIELLGAAPAFEEGAKSKTLIVKATPEGWKFSVKFVPPIVQGLRHIA